MHGIDSVTFFFPYKEVSGVPVVFSTAANYISKNLGVRCYLVDYADGYMAKHMQANANLELLIFEKGKPFQTKPGTHFVMQSKVPYSIAPELVFHPETKIVYWNLHPYNLVPTFPIPGLREYFAHKKRMSEILLRTVLVNARKRTVLLIEGLTRGNALFFMDESNWRITSDKLKIEIPDQTYLPVPAECDGTVERKKAPASLEKALNAAWIGRLCDFKIHILIYTLRKLNEYCAKNRYKINFYVIGDGPLKHLLDETTLHREYLNLILLGRIELDELADVLEEKVDLLFAMGASALEGAKIGIPTVLLDASYSPIDFEYGFRWLFESRNYDLANFVIDYRHLNGDRTMDTLMASVRENYAELSKKSIDYFSHNHALSVVCRRLVALLGRSHATYSSLDPEIFRNGMFMRAYLFVSKVGRHLAG